MLRRILILPFSFIYKFKLGNKIEISLNEFESQVQSYFIYLGLWIKLLLLLLLNITCFMVIDNARP